MSATRLPAVNVLALVCALASSPAALAATGRTLGTFAISPTGAATYTIPIWAPPGPNGLQPQITLTYSSQTAAGAMGVGWSLTGLSSIYRCNQTAAQDAAPAPVALAYADRFCMDGKRLRLTSSENLSTYGQDGTTYQTEIADFSNVTAHGSAGNGPAYFTVQARNGRTYEYGNTSDSRVLANGTTASSWMLDKVTDRAGNTMIVTWKPADLNLKGATVPASISWTPSSASTYEYSMQFNYQALSLASTAGYFAGQPVQNFYSLASIQLINNSTDTTTKDYFLSYTPSPTTGRQTLTNITECADSAQSNCLYPTTITYQNGQAGIATTPSTVSGSSAVGGAFVAFDFNGDGINDIAYLDSGAGVWKVAFGSASGYSAPVSTPFGLGAVAIGNRGFPGLPKRPAVLLQVER
jgi:hypothetical protein